MFNHLVNASLKHRVLVLAAAVILVLYGGWASRSLSIDVFPDLNKPTVALITEAPGLAPEETELLVTFPLETALNGMPGLTRIRSTSSVGLSIVHVEFEWGSDIYRNRQLVNERLALVRQRLPAGVTPVMGAVSSMMGEIMMLAVSSKTLSPMEIRELSDWAIRPRLLSIPGISQIIPIGGEVRQYRVVPNPAAMYRLAVSADALRTALNGFAGNSGGGFVDQHAREYMIRNIGRSTKIDDLRQVVISHHESSPILLHQVATVEFGAAPKRGDAGYMGGPAVIISVHKQPGTDTLKLTREVETAVAELSQSLPHGVVIDGALFRQSSYIEASIGTLVRTLIEASVVVSIVLFLFMLNARTTLISLTAIPISLLITLLMFRQFGLTINTMTLGGLAIAIGELVDDAVVDVENIHRRLRQCADRLNPATALRVVAAASLEVRSSIVYSTLIVILVFLPLFALPGVEGRLFTPLGITYVVAIIASLLTSLTVTPVLCYFLLPRKSGAEHGGTPLVDALKRLNRRMVGMALDNPGPLLGGVVTMVVLAMVATVQLPRIFLPPFNEGTITVMLVSNPGISVLQSSTLGRAAERLLLEVPEVAKVSRRTGRAELDEHAEGVNVSEIEVSLRRDGRSTEEVIQDIRARVSGLPVSVGLGQPMSHRIEFMLSGVRGQMAVKLFGDDLDRLRSLAAELEGRMKGIPGLADLATEKQVRIPQVRVVVDYAASAQFGVVPAHITDALEWLTKGSVVSQIIDGARRFDVVMRLNDQDRTTWGLRHLLVEAPNGNVPLSAVASIEETDGPNQIIRENGRRRIAVVANAVPGADLSAIASAVRAEIAKLDLPSGYFASLEGTSQAQEESQLLLIGLSSISLALIFLVLFIRYRSVALALIIITNIPLALIGSVVALWIAGQPLSVASMVGFITLAGISTRNGILKISHYINLALNEGERFGRRQILRGSDERLTPVLMTALSASLALVPLMGGGAEPGKEVLYPVAVTIFGGLVSATMLDALLTPVLFHLFGRKAQERLSRREVPAALPQPVTEAY